MRSLVDRMISGAVLTGLAVAVAYAASVHLKPPHRNPTFLDQGLFLESVGNLAGLGDEDLVVSLAATANATATCTNPGSGVHQPAGQNPAPVTVSGTTAIPAGEIQNGNVSFDVKTNKPVTPVQGAPECPNTGWTEDITDLSFTSGTITVEQPAGTKVLTVACAFNPATSNGAVPNNTVTCTVQ